MTDLNTAMRKGHFGWTCETTIPLGFSCEGKPAQLDISTYKTERGIVTRANVKLLDGHFVTTRLYHDYSRLVEQVQGRATEKTIRERHALCLLHLDTLKAEAHAHYVANGEIPAEAVQQAA